MNSLTLTGYIGGPISCVMLVCVVVLVIGVIWYISTMNSFRAAEVKIEEAESGIDVALTKRYDVLTKMLEVAKNYLSQEKQMILETIRLRSNMTMNERNEAVASMEQARREIFAVGENYPQLGASEQFKQLQLAIADTEEHLQAARRAYNANVSHYNRLCVMFPSSLVASQIGATEKPFFEAEEHKRQDVSMKF